MPEYFSGAEKGEDGNLHKYFGQINALIKKYV